MGYSKIRPRRGTLYEWSTYNPVLESGELAIEYPDTGIGSGLCKIKIGNGIDKYTELAYAFDGTAANSINGGTPSAFSIIQLRSGTAQQWHDVNPVLNRGEAGYCYEHNSIKVGDGQTAWNNLEYLRAGSMVDNEYDFGNEEDDEIYGGTYGNMEHNIESGVDIPYNVLPPDWNVKSTEQESDNQVILNSNNDTAGLNDLLDDIEDDTPKGAVEIVDKE